MSFGPAPNLQPLAAPSTLTTAIASAGTRALSAHLAAALDYACRAVINGVHAIIFSENASAVRGFFGDTLDLPAVDAGGGWSIFALPPAELAAHPTDGPPHHELYLMCDDIHATVEDLERKGVEFSRGIDEERWGLTTAFKLRAAANSLCTSHGIRAHDGRRDDGQAHGSGHLADQSFSLLCYVTRIAGMIA